MEKEMKKDRDIIYLVGKLKVKLKKLININYKN